MRGPLTFCIVYHSSIIQRLFAKLPSYPSSPNWHVTLPLRQSGILPHPTSAHPPTPLAELVKGLFYKHKAIKVGGNFWMLLRVPMYIELRPVVAMPLHAKHPWCWQPSFFWTCLCAAKHLCYFINAMLQTKYLQHFSLQGCHQYLSPQRPLKAADKPTSNNPRIKQPRKSQRRN